MKIYYLQHYCGDEYTASWYNNFLYFQEESDCDFARDAINEECAAYFEEIEKIVEKARKAAASTRSYEKEQTIHDAAESEKDKAMADLLARIRGWGIEMNYNQESEFKDIAKYADYSSRAHPIFSSGSEEITQLKLYQK